MTNESDAQTVYGLEANLDAAHERREVRDFSHEHDADDSNDHLASIYDEQEEQFATVVPFIRQGLEQDERCLYVADDNTKSDVLNALRNGGIDVKKACESGALSIHTKEDTYLRTGKFDRDAMLDFWKESLATAQDQEGFEGIRAAAEMTWAVDSGTNFDYLVGYEALLNNLYAGENYTVLCQYNRDRFPPRVVSDVIQSHPLVVHNNTVCQNFDYHPPDELFGSDGPPLGDEQAEVGTSRSQNDSQNSVPSTDSDATPQSIQQYRRLIEESTDVVTIIDEEGRFKYVSPAVERRLGYSTAELCDETVFTYIHPEDETAARKQFETLVEQPKQRIATELRFKQRDGTWLWLELRGRTLLNDAAINGIIVYARDVTERKEREQALHESEQRFRALFEEAFDAMVLANDDGQYVDANQAACDLFGLPREELVGRSIAEFAPDDYDFETAWQIFQESDHERGQFPLVRTDGTKRIVEFAATPDVVPGRHLSVIRDVTDRVQHEQTLTALHDASHNLIDAESRMKVAENIVDTASKVLSMDTAAVFLFNPDEGLLKPTAVSNNTVCEKSLGSLAPDRNSITGRVFLDGQLQVFEDVRKAENFQYPELPVRGGLFLPIGDYGVCIVGDTNGPVSTNNRELAEILMATAETALDSLTKENELRKRETELQSQNQQLNQVNQVQTAIRHIHQTLVQAETRNEIEAAVCKHLSALNGIAFTWISERDSNNDKECLIPREWSGSDTTHQYLDTVSLALDTDNTEPTTQAAVTQDMSYVENIAEDLSEDSWRRAAITHGFRTAVSIPLTYKQFTYGTLTIYAECAAFFEELPRTILDDLGSTIANAINSVEHQNAVLSEATMTELEFRFDNKDMPIYYIASRTDCSLSLRRLAPQPDGDILVYLGVEGAPLDSVTTAAMEVTTITEASVVTDKQETNVIKCRLSERPLLSHLADRGVRVRELTVDPTSGTLVVDLPDTVDATWVNELVEKWYPNAEFVAKREQMRTESESEQNIIETYRSKLTPRQREVLRTAYLSGYFQSPSECTGEELAEHLDVSPQTVYRHIKTAERKLIETVFDEGDE